MAVEGKSSGGGFNKRGASFGGGAPRIFTWLIRIALVIVAALCLFGFINQAVTGQAFVDWLSQTGRTVGDTIVYIFKGDENAPVDVTDQGVYVDGYAPDGSKKIQDVVKE